jgi:hypothetical protein
VASELTSRGRRYVADAARAFERSPVEVALAILLAVLFSIAIELEDDALQAFAEVAAAAVLAVVTAWGATLLHALGRINTRTRWIATAAGAVLAAVYGLLIVDFDRLAELWRAVTLGTAGVFALIALPALGAPAGERTVWMRRVDARFVLRMIGVLLYGAALFAGLALALAAVNTLFELDFESKIYAHVFGWIFLALVPWVVAGGLDDYVRPGDDASQVASVAHRMSAFLIPPLLAVYYVILYSYGIRIAVTGEVPKNLLSPLVIAAGALAALALLLFDPCTDSRATMRPLRLAAPFFMPPALLGIWALTQRLEQYGWTEFRALRLVLLGMFGLLALLGTVHVVRRRALPLHLLPASLALVLLLTAVGPWSVMALSRRSQQARLATALEDAGFSRAGERIRADSIVAHGIYEQLRSTAAYLHRNHGVAALPPALARMAGNERWVDFAARLGLRDMQPTDIVRPAMFARLEHGAEISPGSWYIVLEGRSDPAAAPSALVATMDSTRLIVRIGGEHLTADLAPLASQHTQLRGILTPERARVPLRDPAGNPRGDFVVFEMSLSLPEPRLHRVVGLLTLR